MQNRSIRQLPAFFSDSQLFGFEKGIFAQSVPLEIFDFTFLHFHDCIELGICETGRGICCVEEQETEFCGGDVQIVFPYQRHLSRNTDREKSYWRWLSVSPYTLLREIGITDIEPVNRLLFEEMGLSGIFKPAEYPQIVELVREMFAEVRKKDAESPHRREQCAVIFYRLLLRLSEVSRDCEKLDLRRTNGKGIALAVEAIGKGIYEGEIPGIAELAALCCMSVSSFRRKFNRFVGISPKEYIIKRQVSAAQNLLITQKEKSILDIGLEVGFHDISGLNRNFRAITGMTPLEFRKKYRGI